MSATESSAQVPSPPPSPAARTTWTHRDSAPSAALNVALALRQYETWPTDPALAGDVEALGGKSGGLMSSTDRVRILRTLAVCTQYVVEDAREQRVHPMGEMQVIRSLGSDVRGDMFASRAHCFAASAIARTWQILPPPGLHVVRTATTLDGQPAVLGPPDASFGETGALPAMLLGAVLVVAVVGFAVALCYNGQAIAGVVDNYLTNDALTKRMMASQAAALQLVDNHSQREIAAGGRPIPYSPEETQILGALVDTQKAIAQRTQSPLPNPFVGAVDAAKKGLDKAASGFGGVVGLAAMGLGIVGLSRVMR